MLLRDPPSKLEIKRMIETAIGKTYPAKRGWTPNWLPELSVVRRLRHRHFMRWRSSERTVVEFDW